MFCFLSTLEPCKYFDINCDPFHVLWLLVLSFRIQIYIYFLIYYCLIILHLLNDIGRQFLLYFVGLSSLDFIPFTIWYNQMGSLLVWTDVGTTGCLILFKGSVHLVTDCNGRWCFHRCLSVHRGRMQTLPLEGGPLPPLEGDLKKEHGTSGTKWHLTTPRYWHLMAVTAAGLYLSY